MILRNGDLLAMNGIADSGKERLHFHNIII